ncbi:MAG: adenylate/guanylate cyclase domain-containing protein [Geminicoccaceae bacterium]
MRRLAAVVCADVVGYSRLVERDEVATVHRLRENWDTIARPAVERHGGRVVKLMGDGALLEFPSVVEAVTCALEMQEAFAAREASREPQERIQYRIGIHLGDVIVDGEDIQGHGPEQLAPRGRHADGTLHSGRRNGCGPSVRDRRGGDRLHHPDSGRGILAVAADRRAASEHLIHSASAGSTRATPRGRAISVGGSAWRRRRGVRFRPRCSNSPGYRHR